MSSVELKGLKGLRNLTQLQHDSPREHFEFLPVNQLTPGKYQPRQQFDEAALLELSHSIQSQGIIQPLVVRKKETEAGYEIIAGERRWRAAQLANLAVVPAIVKVIDDNVALAYALIENIQRQNLNVIEEALAYARFKEEFNMTHEEIAEMVGRSRTSITNSIRLLSLRESVKQCVIDGKINMGHARALLTLELAVQDSLCSQIIAKSMSVREAEKLAAKIKSNSPKHPDTGTKVSHSNNCDWSRQLSSLLKVPVSVHFNQKGVGRIVIGVNSIETLHKLIEQWNK